MKQKLLTQIKSYVCMVVAAVLAIVSLCPMFVITARVYAHTSGYGMSAAHISEGLAAAYEKEAEKYEDDEDKLEALEEKYTKLGEKYAAAFYPDGVKTEEGFGKWVEKKEKALATQQSEETKSGKQTAYGKWVKNYADLVSKRADLENTDDKTEIKELTNDIKKIKKNLRAAYKSCTLSVAAEVAELNRGKIDVSYSIFKVFGLVGDLSAFNKYKKGELDGSLVEELNIKSVSGVNQMIFDAAYVGINEKPIKDDDDSEEVKTIKMLASLQDFKYDADYDFANAMLTGEAAINPSYYATTYGSSSGEDLSEALERMALLYDATLTKNIYEGKTEQRITDTLQVIGRVIATIMCLITAIVGIVAVLGCLSALKNPEALHNKTLKAFMKAAGLYMMTVSIGLLFGGVKLGAAGVVGMVFLFVGVVVCAICVRLNGGYSSKDEMYLNGLQISGLLGIIGFLVALGCFAGNAFYNGVDMTDGLFSWASIFPLMNVKFSVRGAALVLAIIGIFAFLFAVMLACGTGMRYFKRMACLYKGYEQDKKKAVWQETKGSRKSTKRTIVFSIITLVVFLIAVISGVKVSSMGAAFAGIALMLISEFGYKIFVKKAVSGYSAESMAKMSNYAANYANPEDKVFVPFLMKRGQNADETPSTENKADATNENAEEEVIITEPVVEEISEEEIAAAGEPVPPTADSDENND